MVAGITGDPNGEPDFSVRLLSEMAQRDTAIIRQVYKVRRSEVYDALRGCSLMGLMSATASRNASGKELEGTEGERYLVIQQNGGGTLRKP